MLLPIAGTLGQPILTTVELRALGPIPQGARIVGTAWSGCSKIDVSCPCDPWTALEGHVRGTRRVALKRDLLHRMRVLNAGERAVVAAMFPWIDEPMIPEAASQRPNMVEAVNVDGEPDDFVDDICSCYNLDGDDAAFLRELLGEE